jgi:hypothetical protein
LLSQQETGKITASIDPCCGRLPPGALSLQRRRNPKVSPPFQLRPDDQAAAQYGGVR